MTALLRAFLPRWQCIACETVERGSVGSLAAAALEHHCAT